MLRRNFMFIDLKTQLFLVLAFCIGSLGCQSNSSRIPVQINSTPTVEQNNFFTGAPFQTPPYEYQSRSTGVPSRIDDPYFYSSNRIYSGLADLWTMRALDLQNQFLALGPGTPPRIIVAIIDTGVDYSSPELEGKVWTNAGESNRQDGIDDDHNGYIDDFMGWNWVNNNNHPVDDSGHGTHIAGIIAAQGGNGFGMVGLAPWIQIMPLKVCDGQGSCDPSDVRAAIQYAIDNGANIINLSLGGDTNSIEYSLFRSVIQKAESAGVNVFVSAGNESNDTRFYVPANIPEANTISAHADDLAPCSTFTNRGWKVDFAAPGCAFNGVYEIPGILSLNSHRCGVSGYESCCKSTNLVDENHCLMWGTSMATPFAVGVAALALTQNNLLRPTQIKQVLNQAVQNRSGERKNFYLGRGPVGTNNVLSLAASSPPGIRINDATSIIDNAVAAVIIRTTWDHLLDGDRLRIGYIATTSNMRTVDLNSFTTIDTRNFLNSADNSTNNQIATEVIWHPQPGKYLIVAQIIRGADASKTYFETWEWEQR